MLSLKHGGTEYTEEEQEEEQVEEQVGCVSVYCAGCAAGGLVTACTAFGEMTLFRSWVLASGRRKMGVERV